MDKKQSKIGLLEDKHGWIFYLLLLFIIITCFLLLVPKVSSRLFPFKRQLVWNNFQSQVKQGSEIDGQKYWEFREFYSPGYFDFNRNGLPTNLIANFESSQISINPSYIDRVFLNFHSPLLTSIDALVRSNKLDQVVSINNTSQNQIIFQKNNETIYKDKNQKIHIIFLKTLNQMKQANGFFDYNGGDKNLVNGKYWLNITEFKLD